MTVSASRTFPGTINPRAARGSPVSVKRTAATFGNYIIDWMGHSPLWVSNKSSAFQEILAFNGTRRFITTFRRARHESLPWARSIQSMPPPPFLWRSILISFSHLRLGLLFHSDFPTKTSPPLLSSVRATCLVHLILYLITGIFRSEYRSWSSSLYSFLHLPVISSFFDPNVFLSTLISNTFSLCSSLNVRSQVSHP